MKKLKVILPLLCALSLGIFFNYSPRNAEAGLQLSPPQVISWTPTAGQQAGGFTINTNTYFRGIKYANLCAVFFSVTGTQATASTNYLTLTLPWASASLGDTQNAFYEAFQTTANSGLVSVRDNSSVAEFYRDTTTAVQYLTGAGIVLKGNIVYFCV